MDSILNIPHGELVVRGGKLCKSYVLSVKITDRELNKKHTEERISYLKSSKRLMAHSHSPVDDVCRQ